MKNPFYKIGVGVLVIMLFHSCGVSRPKDAIETKVYVATFYDSINHPIQMDTLIYKLYNEKFLMVQQKVSWDLIRIRKINTNTETIETSSEITGLVVSKEEVWLHPPRLANYWMVTEFAPFPKVKLPLVDGLKYQSKLNLGTYANKENGAEVLALYEAKKVEPEIWRIESVSNTKKGMFKATFTYHERLGFTLFHYTTPNSEQLIIQQLLLK